MQSSDDLTPMVGLYMHATRDEPLSGTVTTFVLPEPDEQPPSFDWVPEIAFLRQRPTKDMAFSTATSRFEKIPPAIPAHLLEAARLRLANEDGSTVETEETPEIAVQPPSQSTRSSRSSDYDYDMDLLHPLDAKRGPAHEDDDARM